ncbi:hypothetical protein [Sphingobacterium prati]|uniref:hypothetical protein n=1 Tax=Sphingobacterium prati TaxID=2737006 RepID=UPI001557243B|nr:hypothetical protein [Sphingobacterium prati]NPE46234.1 hypothetical protein [Sphingobacterium prati]
MEKIKKYGKVLLGVAILGAGAGMAHYAQAQKASKLAYQNGEKLEAVTIGKATMRYWVNDQATGKYIEVTTPPNPIENCQEPSPNDCVVQSENASLPSTLDYSQATPANGVQPHPDSDKAFYQ